MAHRGSAGRTSAATFLVVLTFAGCAVVLDASSDLGPHCAFEGEIGTTCGLCVTDNCQAELDACCGDADCADELDDLDDCAEGDVIGCLDLYLAYGPVGQCVETHCQAACDPYASGEGGRGTGGESGGPELITVCTENELNCLCHAEEDTGQSSTICGGTFEGCCSAAGYPGLDLACGCFKAECVDYGSFCECGYFDADGSDSTSCSVLFPVCCFDSVEMTCVCQDAGECQATETLVESCSAYELGCGSDSVETSSCDF